MSGDTILFADDEPAIRKYVGYVLAAAGFTVLEAADGVDALEQLHRRNAPIDLLLTDIRMPRMSGVELARSVLQVYPDTPVLYISGYPFELEEERAKTRIKVCGSLGKPFTRATLLEAVHKCLAPSQAMAGSAG